MRPGWQPALRASPGPEWAPRALAPSRPRRWWHHLPGLRRLARFQEAVRARLAAACALEHPPPERFGFRFEAATRLFLVTGVMHRRYFRVECHGIEALPRGPVMLVANHGSHVLAWDGAMILTACLLDADPPLLVNPAWLARLVRTPVAPLTPTLVVPLPVKYRIHFGAPLRFRGPAAPDAVARHVAEVRAAVQELIRRGLRMRRHVFF